MVTGNCKSKMAAFKYVMNHSGQCYLFRNREEGGIGAKTWPSSFHGTLHKCISTMAALPWKQVKVNNMKILDNNMIFAQAMALQCSQRNCDTKHLTAHELPQCSMIVIHEGS